MAANRRRDLLGGLMSFGIEALILVGFALLAAALAGLAIVLVG